MNTVQWEEHGLRLEATAFYYRVWASRSGKHCRGAALQNGDREQQGHSKAQRSQTLPSHCHAVMETQGFRGILASKENVDTFILCGIPQFLILVPNEVEQRNITGSNKPGPDGWTWG